MNDDKQGTVIHAKGLTRTYFLGGSEINALNRLDLSVQRGELVLLKGSSGSGKSTFLSLLAGLDRPTSGILQIAGYDLTSCDEDQLVRFRREVISMVFQSFNLLPTLNVVENICLPAMLAGHSQSNVRVNALELAHWLKLGDRLNHFPGQLSGGEMQRTAIARALITNPKIILADEPTGNLDSRNGEAVVELLADLNRKLGRTVVIATHSTIADSVATREICLKDGMLVDSKCEA